MTGKGGEGRKHDKKVCCAAAAVVVGLDELNTTTTMRLQ